MKQYYINEFIYVCYPYESSKLTTEYGVLKPYIGKLLSREQIDVIIAKMITHHPYVEGAMRLEFTVVWTENGVSGDYHRLVFRNDNYKKQSKGNLSIKYETIEDEVNTSVLLHSDINSTLRYLGLQSSDVKQWEVQL